MDHNHVCVLEFPTHRCHIQQSESGRIHCFKYDQSACDFAVFESSDQDSAADYIMTALPDLRYYIAWSGDRDSEE